MGKIWVKSPCVNGLDAEENADSDIKIAKKSQGINEILLAWAKNSQDHSTSKAAFQIQTRFFTNNIE